MVPMFEMTSLSTRCYLVHADLPGIPKEQVQISVKDDILTLSGERSQRREEKDEHSHIVERSQGKFSRSLRLPRDANVEDVKATMEHGVLELVVGKKVKEDGAKKITIHFYEDGFFFDFDQGNFSGLATVFDVSPQDLFNTQIRGQIEARNHRAVVFPDFLHHKVKDFELEDETKPGFCRILAFFLVHPLICTHSTRTVAMQQREWVAQDLFDFVFKGILPYEIVESIVRYLGSTVSAAEAALRARERRLLRLHPQIRGRVTRLQTFKFDYDNHELHLDVRDKDLIGSDGIGKATIKLDDNEFPVGRMVVKVVDIYAGMIDFTSNGKVTLEITRHK
ncbi:hypothetical protein HDU78_011033 [Chytriomyces hyalinus]|nr:hypothetical protein HDU78_011033 [Chytriomyces hyalinus]